MYLLDNHQHEIMSMSLQIPLFSFIQTDEMGTGKEIENIYKEDLTVFGVWIFIF